MQSCSVKDLGHINFEFQLIILNTQTLRIKAIPTVSERGKKKKVAGFSLRLLTPILDTFEIIIIDVKFVCRDGRLDWDLSGIGIVKEIVKESLLNVIPEAVYDFFHLQSVNLENDLTNANSLKVRANLKCILDR